MSLERPEGRAQSGIGRLGIEIELLAPPGRSRMDLAQAIADNHGDGACVRRFFHPQGEPSKAPGTPFFESLTLGFSVENKNGDILAQCVDDLTLQDDLNPRQPPLPGWYRIVSDDARFLRLALRHADAAQPLESVLNPIAEIFGGAPVEGTGGMMRVADETGAPIVLGARLPGERERPCELITPPIDDDHLNRVQTLLDLAISLGFTAPAEGAIHLHYDATPLCSAPTLANLVRFFGQHGDRLKELVATNPRCRRLGPWPAELFELVATAGFVDLDWEQVRLQLSKIPLTKYCDFNLRNMAHPLPDKHTFEVRILPVWLDGRRILDAAEMFASILRWAIGDDSATRAVPDDPCVVFGNSAPL